MPRSRSRSPRRGYDRQRRKRSRSRSPYQSSRRHRSRSRSPRRRRSRTPPPRRPRSPYGRQNFSGSRKEDDSWKPPANPADMTLGGSLGVTGKKKPKKKKAQTTQLVMADMAEGMTDEDKMMQQIMGFQGFETTKGKKVDGNNVYAINKKVERKYRQYMNRKGGFNRPLEFMP